MKKRAVRVMHCEQRAMQVMALLLYFLFYNTVKVDFSKIGTCSQKVLAVPTSNPQEVTNKKGCRG